MTYWKGAFMAYHDTTTSYGSDLAHRALDRLVAFLHIIGGALTSVAEANQRVRLVEKLNVKSDDQLAELGIRREDIVRYAFRDMMHF